MFCAWIILCVLLTGTSSFLVHNTHHSLCLEDTVVEGPLLLKKCSLDSVFQQWIWWNQRLMKCVGTSRCLSAHHRDPVQTISCEGTKDGTGWLLWDCEGDRLIGQNSSLELSTNGKRVILSHKSKRSKWRSLDAGDICQERLRSRRASHEPDEFEVLKDDEERRAGLDSMTEEQREYFHWYYRTEDATPWKFAMLALSFVCLLVGFMLLGMGSMASKNRKKIAKYKAAATLAKKPEAEELQVIREAELESTFQNSSLLKNPVQGTKFSSLNGEVEGQKPGGIVVTCKDGNVFALYPDPAVEVEQLEKEEEEATGKMQRCSRGDVGPSQPSTSRSIPSSLTALTAPQRIQPIIEFPAS
ncbi:solute carrier family 51 subunit beta [Lampris incognitus]|uniref:solute carrier family 51 subunit beta n=1 Tax=Lampris incognitus TaxID=2546036 RepID=UPI0024B5EDE2|nr:solute carrier family 51 subunit beta [Lampris incognitus]